MRLEFIYLVYSEITGESREFPTRKEADAFVKFAKKEDKRNRIDKRWKQVREERYYD